MENNEREAAEHAGHRERIRRRAEAEGLLSMQPHEVMELILYFALPRKDVNDLAHRLIDKFGSLKNVLSAGTDELMAVKGVGFSAAKMITAFGKAANAYIMLPEDMEPMLLTRRTAVQYASSLFKSDRRAQTWVALVNSGGGVSFARRMHTGARWYTEEVKKFIIERVLAYDAHEVVIISRRMMDLPRPFESDLLSLRELSAALNMVDAYILDFIIIGENKNVSMRQVADIGSSRHEVSRRSTFLQEVWLKESGNVVEAEEDEWV